MNKKKQILKLVKKLYNNKLFIFFIRKIKITWDLSKYRDVKIKFRGPDKSLVDYFI